MHMGPASLGAQKFARHPVLVLSSEFERLNVNEYKVAIGNSLDPILE